MNTPTWKTIKGDCVVAMQGIPADSIDAIVCDPPYGLEFMGKGWDRLGATTERVKEGTDDGHPFRDGASRVRYGESAKSMQAWHEAWATEALRILKPGGHLLAFGGTRTYHRLACALEDAGFEIRDCLSWMYGSGFPKSLDVAKAIDKAAGAEREVVGTNPNHRSATANADHHARWNDAVLCPDVTEPATPEAVRWDGWGTALKPGWEPIILARKPLGGTVAANVLEHGTGAINVDGCRIGGAPPSVPQPSFGSPTGQVYGFQTGEGRNGAMSAAAGRWPANVVLAHHEDCIELGPRSVQSDGHYPATRPNSSVGDEQFGGLLGQEGLREAYTSGEVVVAFECHVDCPVRLLDEQTGDLHSQDPGTRLSGSRVAGVTEMGTGRSVEYADRGGASRFFYTAKASRAERNAGLEGLPDGAVLRYGERGQGPLAQQTPSPPRIERNVHPTVKPVDLMRWLVRLVTPPGGVVLDPFLGSGSTGIAAVLEGYGFVGIEREAEYLEIAERRIAWWHKHGPDAVEIVRRSEQAEAARVVVRDAGQLDLLGGSQ